MWQVLARRVREGVRRLRNSARRVDGQQQHARQPLRTARRRGGGHGAAVTAHARTRAARCYAMLCCAVLCYAAVAMLCICYAMLCYAMLCYAMLCSNPRGAVSRRCSVRRTSWQVRAGGARPGMRGIDLPGLLRFHLLHDRDGVHGGVRRLLAARRDHARAGDHHDDLHPLQRLVGDLARAAPSNPSTRCGRVAARHAAGVVGAGTSPTSCSRRAPTTWARRRPRGRTSCSSSARSRRSSCASSCTSSTTRTRS